MSTYTEISESLKLMNSLVEINAGVILYHKSSFRARLRD